MSFDIEQLLDFVPPRHRCIRCLGIFGESEAKAIDARTDTACPSCGLRYQSVDSPYTLGYGSYADMRPTFTVGGVPYAPPGPTRPVELGDDLLDHAKQLARLCRLLSEDTPEYAPLRVLIALLQSARSFVHLVTFGLSQTLLGVLEVVGQSVEVAGIVSHADPGVVREIEQVRELHEAPFLDLRIAGTKGSTEDQPHVKLIVVDGLVCVTGSCNLTAAAWRKAAKNMELVEGKTTVDEVVTLNNRYFSSHWRKMEPRWEPPAESPKVPDGWLLRLPPEDA